MEISFGSMNNKDKNFSKYQELRLDDLEFSNKTPEKKPAKTYTNNSYENTNIEDNKGVLLLNSVYFKTALDKNLTQSTKKRKKKEILYKYVNHSYFKDSLGSIPGKSEIILLDNKHKKKDRFSFNEPTFNKIKDNIPGVGTYNLEYDWNLKNNGINMEGSEEKRFAEDYSKNNYLPCVGHYDAYKGEKYEKEKNNLRYDSLYYRTRVFFNDNNSKNVQNKGFIYNPKFLNDINNKKKKFNFASYSSRDNFRGSKIPSIFSNINNNPGPNYYFNEFDFELTNKNSPKINRQSQSTCIDSRYLKEYNIFDKKKEKIIFSGINKNDNDKPSFSMKQNGNSRNNKVYNLEDIFRMKNEKKIIIDNKKELEKKIKENEKNVTSKKLRHSIEQDNELEKIKKILGNDNGRPDFFYLSPERWKNNKRDFKVPGPAYYFYHSKIL